MIPLHPPPGDTSTERTLKIDGTPDQIESAKQLVNQILTGEVCYQHNFLFYLACHFWLECAKSLLSLKLWVYNHV